ncbi:hypothetical protein Tco_1192330 [Tanacetum coccineum]
MGNGDDVFLGDAPIIALREYVSQDPAEKMMNSVRMSLAWWWGAGCGDDGDDVGLVAEMRRWGWWRWCVAVGGEASVWWR